MTSFCCHDGSGFHVRHSLSLSSGGGYNHSFKFIDANGSGYADVAAGLSRRMRIAGHEPTSGLLATARGECRNPNVNVAEGLSTSATAARNCMAVLAAVNLNATIFDSLRRRLLCVFPRCARFLMRMDADSSPQAYRE